jgi:hypothetical protein
MKTFLDSHDQDRRELIFIGQQEPVRGLHGRASALISRATSADAPLAAGLQSRHRYAPFS